MEEKEIVEKFKNCKTVEELKAFGKEIGYNLDDEEAKGYFDKFCATNKSGELTDDELSNVSGGGCTKWRKGSAYSGDDIYHDMLIVTRENSCMLYKPYYGHNTRCVCVNCKHCESSPGGLILYCRERYYQNDPCNP